MLEFFKWAVIFLAFLGAPLVSLVWLYLSWNRYKETIPFTPEHQRKKVRLIIAAILAGILVGIYLVVMAIYGVTVFFAEWH